MKQPKKGGIYEDLALQFLLNQNLTHLFSNWHCRLGEIDLIMQDANVLLFIEVRARNNLKYVDSAASISYQKQQKIIQAAQTFLMQNAKYIDYYCRFDVIAIDNGDIKWIQNAFEVE